MRVAVRPNLKMKGCLTVHNLNSNGNPDYSSFIEHVCDAVYLTNTKPHVGSGAKRIYEGETAKFPVASIIGEQVSAPSGVEWAALKYNPKEDPYTFYLEGEPWSGSSDVVMLEGTKAWLAIGEDVMKQRSSFRKRDGTEGHIFDYLKAVGVDPKGVQQIFMTDMTADEFRQQFGRNILQMYKVRSKQIADGMWERVQQDMVEALEPDVAKKLGKMDYKTRGMLWQKTYDDLFQGHTSSIIGIIAQRLDRMDRTRAAAQPKPAKGFMDRLLGKSRLAMRKRAMEDKMGTTNMKDEKTLDDVKKLEYGKSRFSKGDAMNNRRIAKDGVMANVVGEVRDTWNYMRRGEELNTRWAPGTKDMLAQAVGPVEVDYVTDNGFMESGTMFSGTRRKKVFDSGAEAQAYLGNLERKNRLAKVNLITVLSDDVYGKSRMSKYRGGRMNKARIYDVLYRPIGSRDPDEQFLEEFTSKMDAEEYASKLEAEGVFEVIEIGYGFSGSVNMPETVAFSRGMSKAGKQERHTRVAKVRDEVSKYRGGRMNKARIYDVLYRPIGSRDPDEQFLEEFTSKMDAEEYASKLEAEGVFEVIEIGYGFSGSVNMPETVAFSRGMSKAGKQERHTRVAKVRERIEKSRLEQDAVVSISKSSEQLLEDYGFGRVVEVMKAGETLNPTSYDRMIIRLNSARAFDGSVDQRIVAKARDEVTQLQATNVAKSADRRFIDDFLFGSQTVEKSSDADNIEMKMLRGELRK